MALVVDARKLRLVLLTGASLCLPARARVQGYHPAAFIKNEILVRFRSEATGAARLATLAAHGHLKLSDVNREGWTRIRLSEGESVARALGTYAREGNVSEAQPNFIYHASVVPNDPGFAEQWGLGNSGQTIKMANGGEAVDSVDNPGSRGLDMGLASAWDQITDCSAVSVAVVDTGINYHHVDLATNLWDGGSSFPNHGTDILGGTNDPMDRNGHGTHVAGIIGAVGGNGIGTTGVCWKAKLMAVRVLDAAGSGTSASVSAGIDWAVAHGAKVVNLSLGQPSFDAVMDQSLRAAAAAGVIVVVAAGNSAADNDSTPTYPCNTSGVDNLICVAALDQAYELASFSNYGATTVQVGAPGVNILSEWSGAVTRMTDSLDSGWTRSGTGAGWGYRTASVGSKPYNLLVDPPGFDLSTQDYVDNSNDRAYRQFDTSGSDAAVLNFAYLAELAADGDALYLAASMGGGDPFVTGVLLDSFSGSSHGYAVPVSYDISTCRSAGCSIGFDLLSNASGTSFGVGILALEVDKLSLNGTTYNVLEGTSMATPHVTGLVAMVMAFNPAYHYQDVIRAVEQGGVQVGALKGRTTTGKAVSALGALSFIQTPSGLAVSKQ